MLTTGTRGDVQPIVALGAALRDAGHDVMVCTNDPFEEFVRAHGLRFASNGSECAARWAAARTPQFARGVARRGIVSATHGCAAPSHERERCEPAQATGSTRRTATRPR